MVRVIIRVIMSNNDPSQDKNRDEDEDEDASNANGTSISPDGDEARDGNKYKDTCKSEGWGRSNVQG